MTDDIFSAESIKKAKDEIAAMCAQFLHIEHGNTMGIPETPQGNALIDRMMILLHNLGYSPEDSSLLISDVLEDIHVNGYKGSMPEDPSVPDLPPRSQKDSF